MKMRRSAKSSVLTGCLGRSAFYSNGKESLTRGDDQDARDAGRRGREVGCAGMRPDLVVSGRV